MDFMTPTELRSRLEGVIAFPVTNFKSDYSLDIDAYRTNVAEMVKFPLCAVVAAGGTGELYSVTPEEHLQLVEATVAEVGDKTAVLAGVIVLALGVALTGGVTQRRRLPPETLFYAALALIPLFIALALIAIIT